MVEITQLSRSCMKAVILCMSVIFVISGCDNHDADDKGAKELYRAIDKNDTASLKVRLTQKEFYGQFEINYHGLYKDSGDVNGVLKGDTLKGTFHYQHYGTDEWYRIPIALLKKNNKLIMGVGSMEIYMNMTFFTKSIPIDYQHPKFVFEKQNNF